MLRNSVGKPSFEMRQKSYIPHARLTPRWRKYGQAKLPQIIWLVEQIKLASAIRVITEPTAMAGPGGRDY